MKANLRPTHLSIEAIVLDGVIGDEEGNKMAWPLNVPS